MLLLIVIEYLQQYLRWYILENYRVMWSSTTECFHKKIICSSEYPKPHYSLCMRWFPQMKYFVSTFENWNNEYNWNRFNKFWVEVALCVRYTLYITCKPIGRNFELILITSICTLHICKTHIRQTVMWNVSFEYVKTKCNVSILWPEEMWHFLIFLILLKKLTALSLSSSHPWQKNAEKCSEIIFLICTMSYISLEFSLSDL